MNQELRELNSLLGQIDGAYHDFAVRLGVSDSMLSILYSILMEGDGCNQSVFYKNSGMGKTTVNSAIRKMEKEGLIYLQPGEGRNTRVFLTEKGHTVSRKTAGMLIQMEETVLASWTQEDRDLFLVFLKRYLEQFTCKMEEI